MGTLFRSRNCLKGLMLVVLACSILNGIMAEDSTDLFKDLDTSSSDSGGTTNEKAKSGLAKSTSPEFELQFSDMATGSLRLSANADDWGYSGRIKAPGLANKLGFQIKSGEFKLVSNWNINLQPSSATDTIITAVTGENALYWNPANFKFGLGWQYYSWGTADKKNPTDYLNPRDYTIGINAEKLSLFSLSVHWYPIDAWSIEGVFVPFKQRDKFQKDFAESTRAGLSALNPGVAVTLQDPAMEPASFIMGFKTDFRFPELDISLSYIYDWDQFYSPEIQLGSTGIHAPFAVLLEKQRIHRFGLNLKTIIEKTGVWLEAGLNLTNDLLASNGDAIRNPSLAWTLGCDTSFGPGDSIYLNVQYIGEYIINFDQSFGTDYASAGTKFNPALAFSSSSYMQGFLNRSLTKQLGIQYEGLDQGIVLNCKLPLLDNLVTINLNAAYILPFLYDSSAYTRFGSMVLNPELDLMPFDSFHIKLGADLCYAWIQMKDGSLHQNTTADRVGIYANDNNMYLKFEYSFNYILSR